MKRTYILIIALLAFGLHEQFVVGQKTSTRCLPIIDRSFQKVNTEKLIVYEVNRDYFLRGERLQIQQMLASPGHGIQSSGPDPDR